MPDVRLLTFNQGDVARSPARGYDAACLQERSPAGPPARYERRRARRLKGLAIDYDPDALDPIAFHAHTAHPGIPRVTPWRGTLVLKAHADGHRIAILCAHRINDHDGSQHPRTRRIRAVLWRRHAHMDNRIIRRLRRRGWTVLFGGDINDHDAGVGPLIRLLTGHYDALAYDPATTYPAGPPTPGRRDGSDHTPYVCTFRLKEKRP